MPVVFVPRFYDMVLTDYIVVSDSTPSSLIEYNTTIADSQFAISDSGFIEKEDGLYDTSSITDSGTATILYYTTSALNGSQFNQLMLGQ